MPSFGERLRQEREARNTTIEDIAAATGIHRGFLEALEKNEFQALPGRAFGKFYLRAYAEILDFDPEPLIVHYDRERRGDPSELAERRPDAPTLRRVEASLAKWREARIAARHGGREIVVEEEAAPEAEDTEDVIEAAPPHGGREIVVEEAAPEAEDTEDIVEAAPIAEPALAAAEHVVDVPAVAADNRPQINDLGPPRLRRPHILAATVGVMGVLASIHLATRSPSHPPPPPKTEPAVTAAPVLPPAATSAPAPDPVQPVPKKAPPTARKMDPVSTTPLDIYESRIGRRSADGRTEPAKDRYVEGDAVAFTTRIRGGSSGRWIRHVWMHEGRAVQSIRLRVGGADWGTHSTKTLWGAGSWSVEARDESGAVLARAGFTCDRRPR